MVPFRMSRAWALASVAAFALSTTPAPAQDEAPAPASRFAPDEPGLRLLSQSGVVPVERYDFRRYGTLYEAGFAPIYTSVCDQPCSARLAPGEYRMALAKDRGRAVPVRERVVVRGPSILRAHYVDRSGARAAGLVVGVAGTIGGVVMMAASVEREDVCDTTSGTCYRHGVASGPLLAGGIGVLLAATVVGSVLLFQDDQAHITVEPLAASLAHPPREARLAPAGAAPQGVALTLRF